MQRGAGAHFLMRIDDAPLLRKSCRNRRRRQGFWYSLGRRRVLCAEACATGRKYSRARATGEDHRLKPVPQVRIENTVGVFLGICVPQAHGDKVRFELAGSHDLWHGL